MSVQVSYKKQFLLGIMLLFLIVIVVETSARIYEGGFGPECALFNSDAMKTIEPNHRKQICVDNYDLKFYIDGISMMEPSQHLPTLNINSHGFRGPEIELEKTSDIYRIFLVGGSTAFSLGSTSDETTITGFIQKNFNSLNLDLNIEVINAGINGAHSETELYLVKNKLVKYDPDLIIIYNGYNDARSRLQHSVIQYEESKNVFDYFKFKSYPFYRTPFVIYKIFNPPSIHLPSISDNIVSNTVSSYENRLIEFCNIGKEEHFATLVVFQPMIGSGMKILSDDESIYSPENMRRTEYVLRVFPELAKSLEDLPCDKIVDFRNILDNYSEPLFYDDIHLNDKGNEIVANKILLASSELIFNEDSQSLDILKSVLDEDIDNIYSDFSSKSLTTNYQSGAIRMPDVTITVKSSSPACESNNSCYIPSKLRIDIGDEVTWYNSDSDIHTITSGDPHNGPDGIFDSDLLMANQTFSVDFRLDARNYPYFCTIHPWMIGEIIVQENS